MIRAFRAAVQLFQTPQEIETMPSVKGFLAIALAVILVLAIVNRVPQLKSITG